MSKPVLLAVDDDPQVLRAVARDLRRRYGRDYSVLRAGSGTEALEVLEELHNRDEPVALVLSDHRMPGLSGVELLGKAREPAPEARRALLTAYADTEAAIAAINESQLDYYFLKPWDPPEERLYPVLDDLLEDWRASFRPGYGGLRVIGHRWSAHTHQLKDFLARNHVPYRFVDVANPQDPADLALLRGRQDDGQNSAASSTDGESQPAHEGMDPQAKLPWVILPEGQRLMAPATADLAQQLGLRTRAEQPFYDLVIVGAGPAGLASAVYGASEGLRTLLVEGEAPGGQAGTSSRIENYLGFPSGLSGSDLARRALTQAQRFGVEVLSPQRADELRIDGPYRHLRLADGSEVSGHALMLSVGVAWRLLPARGAEQLTGRGVYYGAALTEALSLRGETVYVVGAGNSAGQAAIYFADYAEKVVMLIRGSSLGAKMSQYLVERIEASPGIEVLTQTEVSECHGEDRLEGLTLRERASGETRDEAASSLFIFIGAAPRTEWLPETVLRDERGFLLTGPDIQGLAGGQEKPLASWPLARDPYLLETSVPGVFAAGDVRHESIKRVASAVGEGSVAVHFIHRHLASL